MKNRLFFQKVMVGLAVLTALIIAGCNADILNGLVNPEDLYPRKGGLIIYNISTSDDIQWVTVTDANGDLVEDIGVQGDQGLSLVPIQKEGAKGIILDPGTYTVAVTYPKGTQPKPKTVTIEWKKNTAQYFSNGAAASDPYGILQISNFSGGDVTVSVKYGGTEVSAATIEDTRSHSLSALTPETYTVEVKMAGMSSSFTKEVQITAGGMTAIMVMPGGLLEEIPSVPVPESNNLWVLNRLKNEAITKVEKRPSGGSSYDAIPGTIVAGGYKGVHLDPAEYDFQITLDNPSGTSLTKSGIMVTNSDPVFLIVRRNPVTGDLEIEKDTSGDEDGDGFPDWWERQYFGEAAVTNPQLPPGEDDADGDGLTNLEEFLYGTKPTVVDSDGDGLTDWEEIIKYSTNPLNPDSDGDGYSDYVEIRDGSNPLDNLSIPRGGVTIVVPWGDHEESASS